PQPGDLRGARCGARRQSRARPCDPALARRRGAQQNVPGHGRRSRGVRGAGRGPAALDHAEPLVSPPWPAVRVSQAGRRAGAVGVRPERRRESVQGNGCGGDRVDGTRSALPQLPNLHAGELENARGPRRQPTTIVNVRDAVDPAASVTVAVKLTVPAVVGVPRSWLPLSAIPAGSRPAVMAQRYGWMPPLANRFSAEATPPVPGAGMSLWLVSATSVSGAT